MAQIHKQEFEDGLVRIRAHITAAEVVALGASTTGEVSIATVPAGAYITRARVENCGVAAATLSSLTASLGENGDTEALLAAATVFAANATVETAPVSNVLAKTAAYDVVCEFTGNANLSTMTGAGGGFNVFLEYRKKQS